MYEHLKQLHEQRLWSNLCQLGSVAMAVAHNTDGGGGGGGNVALETATTVPPASGPSSSSSSSSSSSLPTPAIPASAASPGSSASPTGIFTPRQRLHVTVMLGEAYLECREHRRAEAMLKDALQIKKHLSKTKSTSKEVAMSPEEKACSDVEIKYKLHLCYLALQQPSFAINILQSVPAKQRTPRFNMALGGLYHRAGMERPAVTCFREVLKACPLSLEAARMLLQLGVKAKEIQELTLEATSTMGAANVEWFHGWILAHAAMAARDYPTAIAGFRQLEERSPLRREVNLLVSLGQAQYYHGDSTSACSNLHCAHKVDPHNLRGMDVLAAIYCRERRGRDLEALATKLIAVSEEAAEPWVAMGYYCYLNKKGSRAVYFAHKACMSNQRSVEALLLKGNVLLDLKKLPDAMNHFREAMLIAPYRFELHKGLIDCYIAQSRHREAVNLAATACKQLSNSPRALTLFASVLSKDPYQMSLPRAKSLLEKALALDSCYLPAVYMLAEILEQEANPDRAIELLRKQLTRQSTCKLHQMLADLLAKKHDDEKAMEHYTLALNLDPKNVSAQEGLQRIEQSQDGQQQQQQQVNQTAAAAAAAKADVAGVGGGGVHVDHSYDLEMEAEEEEGNLVGGDGAAASDGGGVGFRDPEMDTVWSEEAEARYQMGI